MKTYLINPEKISMTNELFEEIELEDANTSKTINRLPDDPNFVYDIFIYREYDIHPFPQRWPISKNTRLMVGALDSPFYDEFKEKAEMYFFDTFWLYESARELITDEYNTGSNELKFLFTVMINRSKVHRRILMKELDNFGLLGDNSRYSFLNPIKNEFNVIWHKEGEQKFLPSQEWISEGYDYESPNWEWKPPVEIKQSLIQIVAETCNGDNNGTSDPTFVTEKTWIPLLLGIPFVVVANQGFHEDLYKRFGIEMYDEIIDYHFDSIPLMHHRIHTLVMQINKLKNQNWEELRKKVSEKVKRNQERVHKLIESGDGVPNIKTDKDFNKWVVEVAQDRVKKGGFIKKLV
tara:strand:- start:226 stop:1272 length:1047 start_codon:yes stop_codon:yes gene_type:complete